MTLKWVCYSPSTFDPEPDSTQVLTPEEIRADLKILRPYFDGLITYGLGMGLSMIPEIARQEGYHGMIIGIWDIHGSEELSAAYDLAARDLIDAICVGNEGLNIRYTWGELEAVANALRDSTGLPVTTTEQIEDYGDERLLTLDFIFPNVHPLWNGYHEAEPAAEWVCHQAEFLLDIPLEKIVFIKEAGFPSEGPSYCTEELQADFWRILLNEAADRDFRVAVFEAFDQPWKHEDYGGDDIGPHWGVFTSTRLPKKVVDVLSNHREE